LGTFASKSNATTNHQPQPNTNQEEDEDNNGDVLTPNNNDNDEDNLADDMGDNYGDSDDGSVYRRPKSPSFDINPEDEVSHDACCCNDHINIIDYFYILLFCVLSNISNHYLLYFIILFIHHLYIYLFIYL
jgi:hypothetical protein